MCFVQNRYWIRDSLEGGVISREKRRSFFSVRPWGSLRQKKKKESSPSSLSQKLSEWTMLSQQSTSVSQCVFLCFVLFLLAKKKIERFLVTQRHAWNKLRLHRGFQQWQRIIALSVIIWRSTFVEGPWQLRVRNIPRDFINVTFCTTAFKEILDSTGTLDSLWQPEATSKVWMPVGLAVSLTCSMPAVWQGLLGHLSKPHSFPSNVRHTVQSEFQKMKWFLLHAEGKFTSNSKIAFHRLTWNCSVEFWKQLAWSGEFSVFSSVSRTFFSSGDFWHLPRNWGVMSLPWNWCVAGCRILFGLQLATRVSFWPNISAGQEALWGKNWTKLHFHFCCRFFGISAFRIQIKKRCLRDLLSSLQRNTALNVRLKTSASRTLCPDQQQLTSVKTLLPNSVGDSSSTASNQRNTSLPEVLLNKGREKFFNFQQETKVFISPPHSKRQGSTSYTVWIWTGFN